MGAGRSSRKREILKSIVSRCAAERYSRRDGLVAELTAAREETRVKALAELREAADAVRPALEAMTAMLRRTLGKFQIPARNLAVRVEVSLGLDDSHVSLEAADILARQIAEGCPKVRALRRSIFLLDAERAVFEEELLEKLANARSANARAAILAGEGMPAGLIERVG